MSSTLATRGALAAEPRRKKKAKPGVRRKKRSGKGEIIRQKKPTNPPSAPAPKPSASPTPKPTPKPTPAVTEAPQATPAPGQPGALGQLLSPAERHVVSRFSYGITPDLAAEVAAAGGARQWFLAQLTPDNVTDAEADAMGNWWPSLQRGYPDLVARDRSEEEPVWKVMHQYLSRALLRRWVSRRQVLEVMTEFWENHLHVPVWADGVGFHRVSYGDTIRRLALASFAELLQATILHPAMGTYLNNAASTKRAINEDLGRELLELHTVGRGNFTEADVRSSAMILSGYRVDKWRTWDATYKPTDHATGPVRVLDFSDANELADGRAVTARYLNYLALHPLTARRIATKLCKEFVGDNPPSSLVDRLASVYLASGSQIIPVLKTLIDSPEFAAAGGSKIRTPENDVVATYRAIGAVPQPPTGDDGWIGNAVVWQAEAIGAAPFDWPRPDGQPRDNESWTSSGRLLASWRVHLDVGNGWWPTSGVSYRPKTSWLSRDGMRFDEFAAEVAATVLHQPLDGVLLAACCLAMNCDPATPVKAGSSLVGWRLGRLLTTLLDSPHHLTR